MKTPQYLSKVDSAISLISPTIDILYVESDHPDVLNLIMDRDTGSGTLRKWLDINRYQNFTEAQRHHAARPLISVYEGRSDYGALKNDEYYKSQQNVNKTEEPQKNLKIDICGKSQTVYFQGPNDKTISLRMALVEGDATKYDPVDLELPFRKYLVYGKYSFLLRISKEKENTLPAPFSDAKFFYLTNADALSVTTLSLMMQAFLESKNQYPNAKLVLTGTMRRIPDAFRGQVTLIRLGSPPFRDVKRQLIAKLKNSWDYTRTETFPIKEVDIDKFSHILTGLTYTQLENVYASLGPEIVEELRRNPNELDRVVWEQKKIESDKDGTLTYTKIDVNPGIVGIGGFSRWMNENLPDLADPSEAEKLGITPPRGIILAGVPGTGKSQLAKQLAYQWGNYSQNQTTVSFIEFKIGNLSSSRYGESESKMEHFLARISEQAPAVLFIDEVEKIFYRDKQGNQGMHEVKKQQMGMLLSWLQEHKENIFTFMTSNDIDILPPELIRSGRLSERFFVFMPNYLELMSMLYVFLKDKAEKQVFSKEFNEEIMNICKVIEKHSSEYGIAEEKDATLDAELSAAFKDSSLKDVLNILVEYVLDPSKGKTLKQDADKKQYEWDDLLKDPNHSTRTPFMTGADMKELVKNTILRLRRKNPKGKWSKRDFRDTMLDCCCCPEFTPYGQSNMDKLVELYLDCDYRDASAHPLLPRFQFNENTGKFLRSMGSNSYIKGTNPDNLYDQYFQQCLMRKIEEAAGEKQRNKERQERRDRLEEAQESHLAFQERQLEFQDDQIARQRQQWAEDDKDKPARKEHERIARETAKYQLIVTKRSATQGTGKG